VPLLDELTEETFGVFSEFYCLTILLASISVFWSDFSLPTRSSWDCALLGYYTESSGNFLNYH